MSSTSKLSAQDALIWAMVMISAADHEVSDDEIDDIQDRIIRLPAFEGFDFSRLPLVVDDCATVLNDTEGLEKALVMLTGALPKRLYETAYVLALDILVADGEESEEELRLIELMRESFDLDELVSSALERGLRARYKRMI
jgi:tellurite resistance protein